MIEKITTHSQDAKKRLLQQYKGSPRINALIETLFGDQIQDIEDAAHQLYSRLDIDESEGVQLDHIGAIVGVDRMGFDDTLYRILVKAKIGKNVSRGTIDDVISVWRLISQANSVQVVETYPASIALYSDTPISGELSQFTRDLMQQTVSAGVLVNFLSIVFSASNAFGFDPDDSNVNGFSDVNDPISGGELAYIQLTE